MYTAYYLSYTSNHSPAGNQCPEVLVLVGVQVWYMKVECFTLLQQEISAVSYPKHPKNIQTLYASWYPETSKNIQKHSKVSKNHPKIIQNHPTTSKIIQKSSKIIQTLYLSLVHILKRCETTCLFTETRWKRFSVAPQCRKTDDLSSISAILGWGIYKVYLSCTTRV